MPTPHVSLPAGPFEPTWESLRRYRVPDWYVDGKFGIFIHWGLYAAPAFGNEWYPRNMYQQGSKEFEHHVGTYGPQTTFGYKDFIGKFTAERFDADAWANLFREALATRHPGVLTAFDHRQTLAARPRCHYNRGLRRDGFCGAPRIP
jgi:hypothetical protein